MCFSLKKLLKLQQILFLVLNYRLFYGFWNVMDIFSRSGPGPKCGPGSEVRTRVRTGRTRSGPGPDFWTLKNWGPVRVRTWTYLGPDFLKKCGPLPSLVYIKKGKLLIKIFHDWKRSVSYPVNFHIFHHNILGNRNHPPLPRVREVIYFKNVDMVIISL